MSRFFKVRIMHTEIHNRQECETFIIHPEKNLFDSFMTEICARLPELFYQPFKLYYSGKYCNIHFVMREILCINIVGS